LRFLEKAKDSGRQWFLCVSNSILNIYENKLKAQSYPQICPAIFLEDYADYISPLLFDFS